MNLKYRLTDKCDYLDQLFTQLICPTRQEQKLFNLIKSIDGEAMKKFTIGNHSLLDLYIKISIKNKIAIDIKIILKFIEKGVGLVFYNNQPSSLKELNSIAKLISGHPRLEDAFRRLGITFQNGQVTCDLDNPLNTYRFLHKSGRSLNLLNLSDEELARLKVSRGRQPLSAEALVEAVDKAITDEIKAK